MCVGVFFYSFFFFPIPTILILSTARWDWLLLKLSIGSSYNVKNDWLSQAIFLCIGRLFTSFEDTNLLKSVNIHQIVSTRIKLVNS
jgi:hypothetical protein